MYTLCVSYTTEIVHIMSVNSYIYALAYTVHETASLERYVHAVLCSYDVRISVLIKAVIYITSCTCV